MYKIALEVESGMFIGNTKEKRYKAMLSILFTLAIIIYAIYFVQIGTFDAKTCGEATYVVCMMFAMMTYGYHLAVSYIFAIFGGISGWLIGKLGTCQIILLFSLVGFLITMIRATGGRRGKQLYEIKSPIKRLEQMLFDNYGVHRTEIVHKLIIITVMITVVIQGSRTIDPNYILGNAVIGYAIWEFIPLFTMLVYAVGVEDAYPMWFVGSAYNAMWYVGMYLVSDLDINMMYYTAIEIMLMFVCAYSMWFGNRYHEKEI